MPSTNLSLRTQRRNLPWSTHVTRGRLLRRARDDPKVCTNRQRRRTGTCWIAGESEIMTRNSCIVGGPARHRPLPRHLQDRGRSASRPGARRRDAGCRDAGTRRLAGRHQNLWRAAPGELAAMATLRLHKRQGQRRRHRYRPDHAAVREAWPQARADEREVPQHCPGRHHGPLRRRRESARADAGTREGRPVRRCYSAAASACSCARA